MPAIDRRIAFVLAVSAAALACTNDYASIVVGAGAGGGGGDDPASSSGSTSSVGASSAGGAGGSTSSSAGGTSTSASGGGGAGVGGGVTYVATVADCIDTTAPNPDNCEAEAGAGSMLIDTAYTSGNGQPRHAFVRFDVDGDPTGKVVTAVTLRLRVTAVGVSDSTGELWKVSEFDRPSLFASVPTNVEAMPIGPDLGGVANAQLVEWQLPPSLVAAGTPVFLGLRPVSSDAPFYDNLNGGEPPALEITYQ